MRTIWIRYLCPILNRTVVISTFAATNGWTAQIKNPSLHKINYMTYQQDPIPVPWERIKSQEKDVNTRVVWQLSTFTLLPAYMPTAINSVNCLASLTCPIWEPPHLNKCHAIKDQYETHTKSNQMCDASIKAQHKSNAWNISNLTINGKWVWLE